MHQDIPPQLDAPLQPAMTVACRHSRLQSIQALQDCVWEMRGAQHLPRQSSMAAVPCLAACTKI